MTREHTWSLTEARERMLRTRRSNDYSPHTLRGYEVEFRKLYEYFGEGRKVHEITRDQIHAYLEWRTDPAKGLSGASANKALDRLNEIIRYCDLAGAGMDSRMTQGWRRAPVMRQERVFVPPEEIGRVLNIAGARSARDRALIATLWYTGGRPEEVVSLKVEDLLIPRRGTDIRVRLTREKVHDRKPCVLEPEGSRELRSWLDAYKREMRVVALNPGWYLFPPTRGDKDHRVLHPNKHIAQARKIVRPVLLAAGYPENMRLGASVMRQSAGNAVAEGAEEAGLPDPIQYAKEFLGHKSRATTEGYLNMDVIDRRAAQIRAEAGWLTPRSPERPDIAVGAGLATVTPITMARTRRG